MAVEALVAVAAEVGGGGRGNFRGFNPGQPHGAIFWIGSNSALNAEPFSLRGQPQEQPASGPIASDSRS